MTSQENSKKPHKLPSVTEALAATEQMQQDWIEHGLDFVHLYVEDVDGDWLETWGEDETESTSLTSAEVSNRVALTDSILAFLSSSDPVAIRVQNSGEHDPLPEIAAHLERCLSLPEAEQPYAVQDLLLDNSASSDNRNSGNVIEHPDTLELAESLVERLLKTTSP